MANFGLAATIRTKDRTASMGTERFQMCPVFHLNKANEKVPKQYCFPWVNSESWVVSLLLNRSCLFTCV